MPFRIPLYVDNDGVVDQQAGYKNLLDWAWEDLDDIDSIDMAKVIADARADQEIASFNGKTTFGSSGFIEFPDAEHMTAFLLKWG